MRKIPFFTTQSSRTIMLGKGDRKKYGDFPRVRVLLPNAVGVFVEQQIQPKYVGDEYATAVIIDTSGSQGLILIG